jgi:hypothetical protein
LRTGFIPGQLLTPSVYLNSPQLGRKDLIRHEILKREHRAEKIAPQVASKSPTVAFS